MTSPEPSAILVIRRDNIGDLLCTTPLIAELRRRHPGARIDALVNSYNAPVLRGNPDLDNVYCYTKAKHRGPGESLLGVYADKARLLWRLRRQHYDVIYLPGSQSQERQQGLLRWLRPQAIRVENLAPATDDLHEVTRCWTLLDSAEVTPPGPMVLQPDPAILAATQSRLQAQPWFDAARPVIAVHISARKVQQRWPAKDFIGLIRALHASRPSQFMLFWSPGDEDNPLHPGDDRKAAEILAGLADLPVLACPTARLADLIGSLACCRFMICSDGGGMHIGAALGARIVCLFGNSNTRRWHPWQVPHRLLQAPSLCVADLSVESVAAACMELFHAEPAP